MTVTFLPVKPSRSESRTGPILALVSLGAILAAFAHPLGILFSYWQLEEYSHGFLLPLVAAALGYHALAVSRPAPAPSWWGVPLIALGFLLLELAELSTFHVVAHYGLWLSFLGVSLAFLGPVATRRLMPAFICLLFAIPLPQITYVYLSVRLQLVSSTLGVWILDAFGIPVFQEGNVIDLGGYRLEVAQACSGLRYLFPLMSLGYITATLLHDRLWKRVTLFLSTPVLSIVMNSIRIAFIGAAVDRWGIAMAEGLVHQMEGWLVFLVCIALLLAEVWILVRIGSSRGQFRPEILMPRRRQLLDRVPGPSRPLLAAATLSAAGLVLSLTSAQLAGQAGNAPSHAPLLAFPMALEGWHGRAGNLDAQSLDTLKLTDYMMADFAAADDRKVNLYIAYYDHQDLGASIHSPLNCIPGGGWQVIQSEDVVVPIPDGDHPGVKVNRMLVAIGRNRQIIYYWFDERGRNITGQVEAKWYLIEDSIRLHRTDGALIRVTTGVGETEAVEDADRRLVQFLAKAAPVERKWMAGIQEAR